MRRLAVGLANLPWLLAVGAACRFGGPSADPEQRVSFPDDGGDEGAAAEPDVGSGADDATLDSTTPATDGAGNALDGASDDGLADALPGSAGDGPGPGTCNQTIPVCDPVHDTGCSSLQQCDVDPSQTTTPAGLCVFNSGPADGAACTSSIFSESCGPGTTCVAGACRTLCFCDSDCAPGSCCTGTSGPPGFLLCQSCE